MIEPKIILTKHAKEKGKERLGLNVSALQNLALTAYTYGLMQDETKGKLRKFLEGKNASHQDHYHARIYGENVFFFTGKRLITLYQLPFDLRKYCPQPLKGSKTKTQ